MADPPGRTPRVRFEEPTRIPAGEATRYQWGDQESGLVADEILVSSDLLHSIIFTLEPGAGFAHSRDNPTIFAADIVYVVLDGSLLVIDPQHGQTVRAETGDAVFFRRDTWHDGRNIGTVPARTLEFFSPTPAAGASSAYAKRQPYLETATYRNDAALGRWPMSRDEIRTQERIELIRPADRQLRLEGDLLLSLIASTEHLTVASAELPPQGSSDRVAYGGEALLIGTSGSFEAGTSWGGDEANVSIEVGDALVLPMGATLRTRNPSKTVAGYVLGVAPDYMPRASAR